MASICAPIVRVIGQCKMLRKPVGVCAMRELEGTLQRLPSDTLGVFASASGFSLPCIRLVKRCLLFFNFVQLVVVRVLIHSRDTGRFVLTMRADLLRSQPAR